MHLKFLHEFLWLHSSFRFSAEYHQYNFWSLLLLDSWLVVQPALATWLRALQGAFPYVPKACKYHSPCLPLSWPAPLQLNNPEKQPSPPRYQKEGAQLFPDMTPAKMGPKKERLFLLIRNIPVPPPPKLDFKFSQALKPLLLWAGSTPVSTVTSQNKRGKVERVLNHLRHPLELSWNADPSTGKSAPSNITGQVTSQTLRSGKSECAHQENRNHFALAVDSKLKSGLVTLNLGCTLESPKELIKRHQCSEFWAMRARHQDFLLKFLGWFSARNQGWKPLLYMNSTQNRPLLGAEHLEVGNHTSPSFCLNLMLKKSRNWSPVHRCHWPCWGGGSHWSQLQRPGFSLPFLFGKFVRVLSIGE